MWLKSMVIGCWLIGRYGLDYEATIQHLKRAARRGQ